MYLVVVGLRSPIGDRRDQHSINGGSTVWIWIWEHDAYLDRFPGGVRLKMKCGQVGVRSVGRGFSRMVE